MYVEFSLANNMWRRDTVHVTWYVRAIDGSQHRFNNVCIIITTRVHDIVMSTKMWKGKCGGGGVRGTRSSLESALANEPSCAGREHRTDSVPTWSAGVVW